MKHYAIYFRITGELISIGKVLPDPMPDDQSFRAYPSEPPHPSFWDATHRTFVLPEVKA